MASQFVSDFADIFYSSCVLLPDFDDIWTGPVTNDPKIEELLDESNKEMFCTFLSFPRIFLLFQ
jgi:hypothetical protein